MDMYGYSWWSAHDYEYGRPGVQDKNSAYEWKRLAEYAERKLETAYKVGYLAAMRDQRQANR